ncbi:hypothetical protein B0H19DRAFT_117009 [Mycena capillaripes]|nr:hypothetical protein B0H19DRAFT_117009 [Mycena capillaripes]
MIEEKKYLIRPHQAFTLDEFTRAYPPETLFRVLVANEQCARFLPKPEIASDLRINSVFARLFLDGSIVYGPENPLPEGLGVEDINFAHRKGLLYIESTARGDSRISFAFPLQRSLFQMSLRPPAHDCLEDITLFQLVTEVIKRFSPDHFTTPKRVGGQLTDRPLEATFQHEFYRCLYEVRPRAVISAEYSTAGHSPAGRIDFLAHRNEFQDKQRSWGIELLRDEDRILDHAYRFDLDGAYHSMATDGITEFVVIDFGTKMPTKPQPRIPDLLHAIFSKNYSVCTLYDNNLVECGKFRLLH